VLFIPVTELVLFALFFYTSDQRTVFRIQPFALPAHTLFQLSLAML
jgi:hypothetical protein